MDTAIQEFGQQSDSSKVNALRQGEILVTPLANTEPWGDWVCFTKEGETELQGLDSCRANGRSGRNTFC